MNNGDPCRIIAEETVMNTVKTTKEKRARHDTSRGIGFAVITVIYIFAAALGILVYRALPYGLFLSLLIADVVATVLTFIFSVILGNASVYDPYWSVQPIVILLGFVFGTDVALTPDKLLMLVAVLLWGIRLTANWAYTFHGLSHQDWRYTMLSEKCGAFYPIINFIGIHMVPTLIVFFCTLPAVYVIENDEPAKSALYIIFFITAFGSVVLQGVSDIQMHKYRKARTTPFIRTGLWRHSRHPNYLAEILMWWSVGLYSVFAVGFEWYSLLGAVLNTVLFLSVSIPMADGRQSRKEGFAEYKSETRALLPIRRFGRK